MNSDEVKANVAKLVAAGAPDQDIHDYLEAAGHPLVTQQASAQPVAQPAAAPDEASVMTKVLGGVASLARDIPGAEALQAAAMTDGDLTKASDRARMGQKYRESLSLLHDTEDAAPSAVRWGARIAGGTLAGAAIPGGILLQGARYGIGNSLLSAEPSTVADRLHHAAWEAPLDAALGKVLGEMLPMGVRKMAGKAVDEAALLRKDAIKAFDDIAYGKADKEATLAAANPTPTAVGDAFQDGDIKPYIDMVKNSSQFVGASPGAIIKEAYKQMSERQGKLGTMIANAGDFKAGSSLEEKEIGAAKQKLLDAADQIMPSFRPAVAGHAELAGQRDAFEAARDATANILAGKSGATKVLETKSPAAFMRSIFEMTPEGPKGMTTGEAKAATQGLLGQLKETPTAATLNIFKLFGIPKAAIRSGRIAPYLNALDRQADNKIPSLLRAAAASSGGLLGH